MNPPDNIYVGGDKAPVSLRSRKENFGAVCVVSKVIGVVQEHVPNSRTYNL
jgi:hypothetical protein